MVSRGIFLRVYFLNETKERKSFVGLEVKFININLCAKLQLTRYNYRGRQRETSPLKNFPGKITMERIVSCNHRRSIEYGT